MTPDAQGSGHLERYSKPMGPGDTQSGGLGKLLRSSRYNLNAILARETLQNSWDARRTAETPLFSMNVLKPGHRSRMALTDLIFKDLISPHQHLFEALGEPELHVMEIHDRGTVGLNGPVDPATATPTGAENNFKNLVFAIGASKQSATAGGTYGFGKTAAFDASRCHTVVYWSVCETDLGPTHRLIACSLTEPFNLNGRHYTGAHWWGALRNGSIGPLTGKRAQTLGELIFSTGYLPGATGTSILVVDPLVNLKSRNDSDDEIVDITKPVRSAKDARNLGKNLAFGLLETAWPKFVRQPGRDLPMHIRASVDDETIVDNQAVAEFGPDSVHAVSKYCLNKIRKLQEGGPNAITSSEGETSSPPECLSADILLYEQDLIPIRLAKSGHLAEVADDFFDRQWGTTIGHLYLVKYIGEHTDCVPRSNCIVLMRGETELVVRSIAPSSSDLPDAAWRGVFKPLPHYDKHFASSEPPTHDEWDPGSATGPSSTAVVRRTLDQIKRKTRVFLQREEVLPQGSGESSREASLSLRHLMPVPNPGGDAEVASRTSSGTAPVKSIRPAIQIDGVSGGRAGTDISLQSQTINFSVLQKTEGTLQVDLHLRAWTPDGGIELNLDELHVKWSHGEPLNDSSTSQLLPGPGRYYIQITAPLSIYIQASLRTVPQ